MPDFKPGTYDRFLELVNELIAARNAGNPGTPDELKRLLPEKGTEANQILATLHQVGENGCLDRLGGVSVGLLAFWLAEQKEQPVAP